MNDLWYIETKENNGIYLRFAKGVDIGLKKKYRLFADGYGEIMCFQLN